MPNPILSPFHTELLQYIQKESKIRAQEEGFGVDVALAEFQKKLQKALLPTSADEELPLSEIIENFQYLFEKRGPVHLERRLFSTFSKREFSALGLERFFPQIYRGLPRLYKKEAIGESHIKKNFTHLPSLLRLMAERGIFQLYKEYPVVETRKITVFVWVMPDGRGDLFAAKRTIEIIQKAFPHFTVDGIALLPKNLLNEKREPFTHCIAYDKQFSVEIFDAESLNLFKRADLIFQIPTYYPDTKKLMEKVGGEGFYSIGEYGFSESSWFHPKSGNRSLGLHCLEKGILIYEKKELPLQALASKELKLALFGKEEVEEGDIEAYSVKSRLYLAYLTSFSGGFVYLHALLKSLEEDEKTIDICTPDSGWILKWLFEQEGKGLLENSFGVGSIDFYIEGKKRTVELDKGGKKVRIITTGPLSQNDFQTLLFHSGEFIAVRGNQSFSEAVSFGKVFFYDGREHARYFIKDLIALAENKLGAYPSAVSCFRGMGKAFLYNLSEEEESWVDESYFQEKEPLLDIALEIGEALKNPDTFLGFSKLNQLMEKEHSFSDFLIPFIQREFCHQKHSDIARLEKSRFDLFVQGGCSFSAFYQGVKEAVMKVENGQSL